MRPAIIPLHNATKLDHMCTAGFTLELLIVGSRRLGTKMLCFCSFGRRNLVRWVPTVSVSCRRWKRKLHYLFFHLCTAATWATISFKKVKPAIRDKYMGSFLNVWGTIVIDTVLTATEICDFLCARYDFNPPNLQKMWRFLSVLFRASQTQMQSWWAHHRTPQWIAWQAHLPRMTSLLPKLLTRQTPHPPGPQQI